MDNPNLKANSDCDIFASSLKAFALLITNNSISDLLTVLDTFKTRNFNLSLYLVILRIYLFLQELKEYKMKQLLLTLLLFLTIKGYTQTFKVSKVETSRQSEYQELNKRFLNKSFKITFNDNSATINPVGGKEPITMRLIDEADNTYRFSQDKGKTTESFMIRFFKTFGVFTSFKFTYRKSYSGNLEKEHSITAKRF